MADAVNQNGDLPVDGAGAGTDTGVAIDSVADARRRGGHAVDARSEAPSAAGDRPDRPVSRLARWLWPPRCLVCSARGGDLDLCPACAAGLPWLGAACRCCAMPLAAPPHHPQHQQHRHPREGGDPERGHGPGEVNAAAARYDADLLCGHCLQRPPPLTETHAACLYGAPLDRLLPRFKFHHDLAAGRLLAQLMAQAFASLPSRWPQTAALLPIPLHPRRLRQRGYDQALELARPLAHALALPLLDSGFTRVRDTSPQSRLDASQRRRNLSGAFQVDRSARLPAYIVLVDDVMTTGATLHAAATALQRAGVQRVDAWVCARVP